MKAENIGTPLINPNKSCNFVFILFLGLRNDVKMDADPSCVTITSGNLNLSFIYIKEEYLFYPLGPPYISYNVSPENLEFRSTLSQCAQVEEFFFQKSYDPGGVLPYVD